MNATAQLETVNANAKKFVDLAISSQGPAMGKVRRSSGNGVAPSGAKRLASKDDDMTWSCGKPQAVLSSQCLLQEQTNGLCEQFEESVSEEVYEGKQKRMLGMEWIGEPVRIRQSAQHSRRASAVNHGSQNVVGDAQRQAIAERDVRLPQLRQSPVRQSKPSILGNESREQLGSRLQGASSHGATKRECKTFGSGRFENTLTQRCVESGDCGNVWNLSDNRLGNCDLQEVEAPQKHGSRLALGTANNNDVEQTNITKGISTDGINSTSTGTGGAWANNLSDWIFFFGNDTVAEAIATPEEMRGEHFASTLQ